MGEEDTVAMQEKKGEGKLDEGGDGSSCEERSKSKWT